PSQVMVTGPLGGWTTTTCVEPTMLASFVPGFTLPMIHMMRDLFNMYRPSTRCNAPHEDLGLEKLFEAGLAVLPPAAAALVSAERRVRIRAAAAAVQRHGPGPDPPRDVERAAGVGAPDRTRQPELGVVGDCYRVGVGVERDHHADRPEDLLL